MKLNGKSMSSIVFDFRKKVYEYKNLLRVSLKRNDMTKKVTSI